MLKLDHLNSHTAVLVIDDNNDFLSPEGKLYGSVAVGLEAGQTIDRLNQFLSQARSHGVPVLRLPMSFEEGYPEMGQEPYGIFGTIKELGAFAAGSWGSEPAEVLDADASDVIIRGKSTACSFASTSLQDWLDENNTKTLILSGLLSNICVEATMRTAYDRGFNVIVVADCVAALDHEHHRAAMANNWPFFAHITTARDLAWSAPADIES